MLKTILPIALVLASAGITFAQTGDADDGIFGSGVLLTGTGTGAANDGTETLYALNMGDNNDLPPTGFTGPVSAAQAGGTSAAPTFSLGTFATGDSLVLNGGSLLAYANSGASETAGAQDLNYNVFGNGIGTGFMALSLAADGSPGGVTGNTRFDSTTAGVNLLAGLAPGTYTLDIYNSSGFTDPNATPMTGTNYDSNGGGDYGFSFTVESPVSTPEPGTGSLVLLAIGGLFLLRKYVVKSRLS